VDKTTEWRSDPIGKLTLSKSKEDFPTLLGKVPFYDKEKEHLVFLGNNLKISTLMVAELYKKCWEIELFLNGSRTILHDADGIFKISQYRKRVLRRSS